MGTSSSENYRGWQGCDLADHPTLSVSFCVTNNTNPSKLPLPLKRDRSPRRDADDYK